MVLIPPGWGLRKVRTGVADLEFQTTSIESSPASAVTTHSLSSEQRIEAANKLKVEKYQHFLSDISSLQPNLKCFEIGSHTGYISSRNKRYLVDLHKYCKKGIKLKNFLQNISSITILSSYYIFNCRNQEVWEDMDVILPPFSNQW